MDKPLRVLHLEDDRDFTALVSAMLEKEGLRAEVVCVADFAAFVAALESGPFDIILADYLLPTCNGIQALQAAQEKCPDIPFLLISGNIGEEAAIESLRCGATDYVLKERLERLEPTVRRAVREARERAQRKRAETELVRREKYFRTLMENSLDVLTILNREGIFQFNSPSVKSVLDHEPKELAGRSAFEFVHPEDLPGVMQAFERTLQRPDLRITHQFRFRRRDGTWCDLETVCRNRLDDPDISGIVVNSRDIGDRKRAAEALGKSEASLAAAQRIAHLGSWELDLVNAEGAKERELRWSDETYRIFGLEPRQINVTAEFFLERVHPDDRQRLTEAVSRALRHREPYDVEHRILLDRGEERMVRERGEFTFNAEGKPVQIRGIVMDITERKHLEEQLRQSQKMEAIGQLAGGVAHDFNNILTVIHGHASLLLSDKALTNDGVRSAQQITQASGRAAALTRQLLTFSRRQVMQPRRLDMNEVVSNMTMMLGRILGEDIALHLNYWPRPVFVQADASMIEQVLLNLAVNARDAMPKGGQLTVKISAATVNARHMSYHPEARTGKFVCLSVVDSGCGIPSENLRRIFDPFFTTKEVGKGTGLGLATVYGIVKQHQGWIEVRSEMDKGSAFLVFLPACNEANGTSSEKTKEATVRGGAETILVVEDETPVRELVCNILAGYGYTVLQAASGEKALDIWRENRSGVDLLLTDLVMPDRLNGRELAEKLLADQPQLKVMFTSGYSADVVGKDFVLQRGLHYLQKPYDPQKLALAVRDCLDAEASLA
jgi:PAS domain S-box-containing protein